MLRACACHLYHRVWPPSSTRLCPVMYELASEAMKTSAACRSVTSARRPMGICVSHSFASGASASDCRQHSEGPSVMRVHHPIRPLTPKKPTTDYSILLSYCSQYMVIHMRASAANKCSWCRRTGMPIGRLGGRRPYSVGAEGTGGLQAGHDAHTAYVHWAPGCACECRGTWMSAVLTMPGLMQLTVTPRSAHSAPRVCVIFTTAALLAL